MYQERPLGWVGAQCVLGPIPEHPVHASQIGLLLNHLLGFLGGNEVVVLNKKVHILPLFKSTSSRGLPFQQNLPSLLQNHV